MKLLVIWNGGSGRSTQIDQLRAALRNHDTTWLELDRGVNLSIIIDGFILDGGQTVIAAGGDGTVHAVVNHLMMVAPDTRPSMAIIPLGTANDFAGTLNILEPVEHAVETLNTGQVEPIDVIRIRGDGLESYYSNVAAGGNCVRVSEQLTDEVKSRWGAFCYVRGAVGVLADMQSYRLTADVDGEVFNQLDSWAVLIANGRTNAGHIEVAPEASPVDGMMDVVIIRDGDVMDMVEIVSGNLLGNFLECDQVIFRKAKRIGLQSDPPMRFTLDGELIDREPIEFEVVPSAIRMFVGPDFRR
ncbi:diacylglycerol/lipid kinase family protein [Rhodopirellula sallentina]|uniref:Diacylglycerol kinase catalytic region n=1 Tax=Rhodopirellula sallentina SM41 TaxID=1263870 RepID=M5U0N8_9BACT|nr:diacylglycerol kinase family protein [Rhodopirellula sallentina]EMI54819.1 diacylglycerol kinase catalytic region [Rhodopirellula sallentina SM41]